MQAVGHTASVCVSVCVWVGACDGWWGLALPSLQLSTGKSASHGNQTFNCSQMLEAFGVSRNV